MTAYTYKLDEKGIPYRVPNFRICGRGRQPEPAVLQADSPQQQPATELLQHSGKRQTFQLYMFEL